MPTSSRATKAWCILGKKRHRLRVRIDDVCAAWVVMDKITRKNRGGLVRAFCPDPKCPEHRRIAFVGTNMIPKLEDLVEVDD